MSFRPLAGMCCVCMLYHVPNEAKRFPSPGGDVLRRLAILCATILFGFPSPGGDVLRPVIVEKYPEYKELFPSPDGDVLRPVALHPGTVLGWFPSPEGDVLRPSRAGHGRTGNCFRPLAGMCCVAGRGPYNYRQAFPSPGGDVLRLHLVPLPPHISVFPSPGGDVLRLRGSRGQGDDRVVSVPWRGCVASANLHKTIFQKGIFSCFPLPFCNIL